MISNYILDQNASKIQAFWRGYRCRKVFNANKVHLQRIKAVMIIQRAVREWLHNKNEIKNQLLKPTLGLDKIEESKLVKFQEEIESWNKNNTGNSQEPEQMKSQIKSLQDQLNHFYNLAMKRNVQRKYYWNTTCTQIEAIQSLLNIDLPSLNCCEKTDLTIFHTNIVSDVKAAKRMHKQEMKMNKTTWWKQLDYNLNDN